MLRWFFLQAIFTSMDLNFSMDLSYFKCVRAAKAVGSGNMNYNGTGICGYSCY